MSFFENINAISIGSLSLANICLYKVLINILPFLVICQLKKKKRLISDNQDKQPINVFFVY